MSNPTPNQEIPVTAPFQLLEDLAICIEAQFEIDGRPKTCFTGVIAGESAVAEYAGNCSRACGMVWVRMDAMYPALSPGIAKETPNNCGERIGMDIEIGVMRCVKVPEKGKPPLPKEMAKSAANVSADALSIWRAISCCSSIEPQDRLLSIFSPVGPAGGMMGGTWSLMVVL